MKESWKLKVQQIIYEAETPAGKLFDIVLLGAILLSVLTVMLESVGALQARYVDVFRIIEWVFTGLFTIEYLLRIWVVKRPARYIFSFYGIVDLLAILPAYVSIFISGGQYLLVIRILRLIRVFRILKLERYLRAAYVIKESLKQSRPKIAVFLVFVLSMVCVMGSLMYLVEGGNEHFSSIPRSIYWAIVTITTVGYGDIAPQTPMGQVVASILMIVGFGVVAVPTGIVTAEMARQSMEAKVSTHACPDCSLEGHDSDAVYCKFCGSTLN